MSASAADIEGTEAGEWTTGTAGNDIIYARGGDDKIYDPAGNNSIDGGEGMDSVIVYEGVRGEYSMTINSDGDYVMQGPGQDGSTVSNVLTNVENVVFNDSWVLLEDITPYETTGDEPCGDGRPGRNGHCLDGGVDKNHGESNRSSGGREIHGKDKVRSDTNYDIGGWNPGNWNPPLGVIANRGHSRGNSTTNDSSDCVTYTPSGNHDSGRLAGQNSNHESSSGNHSTNQNDSPDSEKSHYEHNEFDSNSNKCNDGDSGICSIKQVIKPSVSVWGRLTISTACKTGFSGWDKVGSWFSS